MSRRRSRLLVALVLILLAVPGRAPGQAPAQGGGFDHFYFLPFAPGAICANPPCPIYPSPAQQIDTQIPIYTWNAGPTPIDVLVETPCQQGQESTCTYAYYSDPPCHLVAGSGIQSYQHLWNLGDGEHNWCLGKQVPGGGWVSTTPQYFTVQSGPLLPAPVVITPTGTISATGVITFEWTAVSGAALYGFTAHGNWPHQPPGYTAVLTGTHTTMQASAFTAFGGQGSWTVSAANEHGFGQDSYASFLVIPPSWTPRPSAVQQ